VGLNVESMGYVESICPGGLIELLPKTQDEVWNFFKKLAWETYAFKQANETFRYPTHGAYDFHTNSYPPDHFTNSYGPSYSYMPHVLCDYYESPYHNAHTYPFRTYVDAACASFEMTDQMIVTMEARIAACSQCFNQSELDSSLVSPKPDISLYDDFEPSYSARPDLTEDMYLPSLDQESDFPMCLSSDLAPYTNSPKGITDDVLVSADPPTTLNDFYEFDVGEPPNTISELDISITLEVKHQDLDESQEVFCRIYAMR